MTVDHAPTPIQVVKGPRSATPYAVWSSLELFSPSLGSLLIASLVGSPSEQHPPHPNEPIFIGVAAKADVSAYLSDVARTELVGVRLTTAPTPSAPPTTQPGETTLAQPSANSARRA